MKAMLIIGFLMRYISLVAVFVVLTTLSRWDDLVVWFGPVFYVVQLVVTCIVAAVFGRHLFMRKTLDAYVTAPPEEESQFTKDWRALDPRTKQILSIVMLVAFYLGACLIASSIAK